jgi:hypothetical protein
MNPVPLVIYLDDVHAVMRHMELCMDCASRVLVVVEDGQWDVTLGHSPTCPARLATTPAQA